MGGRFWIGLMASLVGIAIAVGISLLVIGAAIAAWGVFGALVVVIGVALLMAWIYDRRHAQPD